uniref:Uncharacterized protein n=1 Tax=Phasianus colchicus TaxID=9054 RepID=A0A669PBF3_PHACC
MLEHSACTVQLQMTTLAYCCPYINAIFTRFLSSGKQCDVRCEIMSLHSGFSCSLYRLSTWPFCDSLLSPIFDALSQLLSQPCPAFFYHNGTYCLCKVKGVWCGQAREILLSAWKSLSFFILSMTHVTYFCVLVSFLRLCAL